MGLIAGVWLLGIGVLAFLDATEVVVKRSPEGLTPQGLVPLTGGAIAWSVVLIIFGSLSGLWGFWVVLHALLSMGTWLKHFPLWWATYLAAGLCQVTVGVLIFISAIKTLGQRPFTGRGFLVPLRVIAICTMALGVWITAARFIFLE